MTVESIILQIGQEIYNSINSILGLHWISERGLRTFKQKIRNENGLNYRSKIFKILFENYLESDKVE